MGNGAAIKRGAREATGDVLVFMDADGQHDPADIGRLLARLDEGFDMVVGARDWSGQAGVGRGVANAIYNRLASWMTGFDGARPDLGLPRRTRRQVPRIPASAAERVFVSDDHHDGVLPQRLRGRVRADGGASARRQEPHPAAARRHPLPADHLQDRDAVFAAEAVRAGQRCFSSLPGSANYVYTFVTMHRFTNMSVLLFSASVIVFLIGLISEQITALMYTARK